MAEFFSIFELRFHTAFEFGDSRQAEFSFLSFLMITQEISHIFCVYRRWNRQNCSILSISNLRLTFLRFSENPFKWSGMECATMCRILMEKDASKIERLSKMPKWAHYCSSSCFRRVFF